MNEDEFTLQAPPWSEEAEQGVLGALLQDNAAFDRAGDILQGRMFYAVQHRTVYEVIASMVHACKPADIITVYQRCEELGRSDHVAKQVTMRYLNDMANSVISAAHIRRHAEIVAETHRERQLIARADEATTIARGQGTASDKLDKIVHGFGDLERGTVANTPRAIEHIIIERLDHITAMNEGTVVHGWTTGLQQLDRMLRGGFQPGRVYLLGGRPGMGKSALALWQAVHSALLDNLSTMYLSQEMPDAEVGERVLSTVGQINYEHIQTGKLGDMEWGRLSEAVEKIRAINFHVDPQPGLTAGDIGIKVRSVRGVNIVVLDYVQLCKGMGEGENNRNGELEVISRAIKQLAKDRNCAMLVLSALGRKVDERAHKRPIMSDFKDCGALEADADVLMALFPLRAMDSRGAYIRGLDILKNRQGPLGCLALDFWPELMTWGESEYKADDLLKPEKKAQGGPL